MLRLFAFCIEVLLLLLPFLCTRHVSGWVPDVSCFLLHDCPFFLDRRGGVIVCFEDLIMQDIFGTTYPYCLVDLDDQGRRTSSVQSASVNPSWNQELTFPVSVQQWILSILRIQVLKAFRFSVSERSVECRYMARRSANVCEKGGLGMCVCVCVYVLSNVFSAATGGAAFTTFAVPRPLGDHVVVRSLFRSFVRSFDI